MNLPAIQIEGISKSYLIKHLKNSSGSGLRHVLDDAVNGFFRKISGKGNIEEQYTREIFWALKDISLEINQGDRVGIIGRNGAGKSTLLKILSRITEPTAGIARINGRVASLLEVGTGFHPELSGRENIFLNGAILGMTRKEIKSKFDEIVAFSEVDKFLDTPVKRYSSGMYVRLAFAVAAHLESEILIIDEVLAVGDMQFQKKCLEKMEDVGKSGRTVLFVSHNMGAISEFCKRVIHLEKGHIIKVGETRDIIQTYLSSNQFEGNVDLSDWHVDRLGNGSMKIKSIRTINITGEVSTVYRHNEPMSLELIVSSEKNRDIHLGVSIRDSLGNLIVHPNNIDDKMVLRLVQGENEIVMNISATGLNNGIYYISVWLGDVYNNLHDRVGNCLSFEIDNAIIGSFISQGKVLISADWKVK